MTTSFDSWPKFERGERGIMELLEALPTLAGNTAVNLAHDNFNKESWIDRSMERWPDRQLRDSGRGLLRQSGKLRRSINFEEQGDTVIVYSDDPKAKAHNEGLEFEPSKKQRGYFWAKAFEARGSAKTFDKDDEEQSMWIAMALAKQITIPKRQFMGPSHRLTIRLERHITRSLKQIFDLV